MTTMLLSHLSSVLKVPLQGQDAAVQGQIRFDSRDCPAIWVSRSFSCIIISDSSINIVCTDWGKEFESNGYRDNLDMGMASAEFYDWLVNEAY